MIYSSPCSTLYRLCFFVILVKLNTRFGNRFYSSICSQTSYVKKFNLSLELGCKFHIVLLDLFTLLDQLSSQIWQRYICSSYLESYLERWSNSRSANYSMKFVFTFHSFLLQFDTFVVHLQLNLPLLVKFFSF